ncbi:MAG: hypothetical protein KDE26_29500, partial [Bacteroidetes bacterium]|nr:hypothetical protein [Bacteroidota bacterium]
MRVIPQFLPFLEKTWLLLLSFILIFGCGKSIPPEIEAEMAHLPDQLDYNYHIKPILSDRCFACHGPDENKREANLRLDIAESAYEALSSGAGKAIVPG